MNVGSLKRVLPLHREAVNDTGHPAVHDKIDTSAQSGDGFTLNPQHLIFAAVGALLTIFIGYQTIHWLVAGRFEVKTDNAYIRADISAIAPKIQGYVDTVHVTDNQHVKAGDLLVTLEIADYAAQLAEAEAALSQAIAGAEQTRARVAASEAALETARSEVSAQRDRLAEATAQSDAAAANANLSSADYGRFEELAEKGHYPKAGLEAAASKDKAAQATLQQSRAAITTHRSELNVSRASLNRAEQDLTAARAAVAGADAQVEAARARLDAAGLDAKRTELRAPIDGVVANRAVVEGQLMNPGQQAMAIVPVSSAYVVANYKETQVEHMRPGQRVRIHIDAYPELKVEGRLSSIAPATGAQFSLIPQDTATGNFTKIVQRVPVRIDLTDEALASGLMRPGLSVEAIVIARSDS